MEWILFLAIILFFFGAIGYIFDFILRLIPYIVLLGTLLVALIYSIDSYQRNFVAGSVLSGLLVVIILIALFKKIKEVFLSFKDYLDDNF